MHILLLHGKSDYLSFQEILSTLYFHSSRGTALPRNFITSLLQCPRLCSDCHLKSWHLAKNTRILDQSAAWPKIYVFLCKIHNLFNMYTQSYMFLLLHLCCWFWEYLTIDSVSWRAKGHIAYQIQPELPLCIAGLTGQGTTVSWWQNTAVCHALCNTLRCCHCPIVNTAVYICAVSKFT